MRPVDEIRADLAEWDWEHYFVLKVPRGLEDEAGYRLALDVSDLLDEIDQLRAQVAAQEPIGYAVVADAGSRGNGPFLFNGGEQWTTREDGEAAVEEARADMADFGRWTFTLAAVVPVAPQEAK